MELPAQPDARRGWLPLPASDGGQVVHLLAWEVGAPGTYAVRTTPAGERLLRVDAAAEGLPPVRVCAEVALLAGAPPRPLPRDLQQVGPGVRDPQRWLRAAREGGAQVRLAHGVDLSEAAPRRCAWPEVLRDGRWLPVDLQRGRLGRAPARVRLGATPAQVELRAGGRARAPLRVTVGPAAPNGAGDRQPAGDSSRVEPTPVGGD